MKQNYGYIIQHRSPITEKIEYLSYVDFIKITKQPIGEPVPFYNKEVIDAGIHHTKTDAKKLLKLAKLSPKNHKILKIKIEIIK